MVLSYIISSIVAGIVASLAMLASLNLSKIWGIKTLDVRMMLGSFVTKKLNNQAKILGFFIFLTVGIMFSFLYGLIVFLFVTGRFGGSFGMPQYYWIPGVNFFLLYLGLLGGFGHGTFMALIGGVLFYELHPLPDFRETLPYVVSALIGHAIFGFTVMLVHNFILARPA